MFEAATFCFLWAMKHLEHCSFYYCTYLNSLVYLHRIKLYSHNGGYRGVTI